MEARIKTKLPQEGTGITGESLTELISGCPTVSGGGKISLSMDKEDVGKATATSETGETIDLTDTTEKTTTGNHRQYYQQKFHKGMFVLRERSSSFSDIHLLSKQNTTPFMKETDQSSFKTNPKAPWQRMPTQNQKRLRSPDNVQTQAKMHKSKESRQELVNNLRGIERHYDKQAEKSEAIVTANRFSILDIDAEAENIETTKAKKVSMPPPIVLYGIDDLTQLTNLLLEVVHKEDYTLKVVNRNRLIVSTKSVEKYKMIIDHIRSKGLIGHTFTRKDERCPRFVIKNLHHSTPIQAIIDVIEETGNSVKGEIVTARKRGTKEPLDTFFVNVMPHENNKLIKEIKYIYYQRVLIQDPKKKTSIPQCTRCQQYGHTKNNCMRPFRCVICAGPHKTPDCTHDKNMPAVCSLCSGSHPANYKGCVVYKEILGRKFQNKRRTRKEIPNVQNIHMSTENLLSKEIPDTVATQNPILRRHMSPMTYNKATKNQPSIPIIRNTNFTNPKSVDNLKSQSTHNSTTSADYRTPSSQEHKYVNNLELLITKQTEKIDQLLQHMGTLMNLLTVLINKIP